MKNFKEIRKMYIRHLGNPYAAEQLDFIFEGQPLQLEPHVRHPYAYISALMDSEAVPAVTGTAFASKPIENASPAASKAEFQKECRRIFAQYRPALDQRNLPNHYRTFITRNESRSGAHRRRVLNGLQKYDLSKTLGLRAQFNREDHVITEGKLRQIEDDSLGQE